MSRGTPSTTFPVLPSTAIRGWALIAACCSANSSIWRSISASRIRSVTGWGWNGRDRIRDIAPSASTTLIAYAEESEKATPPPGSGPTNSPRIEGARRWGLVSGRDLLPTHAKGDGAGGRRCPSVGDRLPDDLVAVERKTKNRALPGRNHLARRPHRLDGYQVSRQDNCIPPAAIWVDPAPDAEQVIPYPGIPVEVAVTPIDLERAVPRDVAHDHAPVRHGRKVPGKAELARTLPGPSDQPHEFADLIDDDNPGRLKVQQIEVTRTIEGHVKYHPELLPLGRVERPDPEHLLEASLEPDILGGEFDDLLGGRGDCGHQPDRQAGDRSGRRHARCHVRFPAPHVRVTTANRCSGHRRIPPDEWPATSLPPTFLTPALRVMTSPPSAVNS